MGNSPSQPPKASDAPSQKSSGDSSTWNNNNNISHEQRKAASRRRESEPFSAVLSSGNNLNLNPKASATVTTEIAHGKLPSSHSSARDSLQSQSSIHHVTLTPTSSLHQSDLENMGNQESKYAQQAHKRHQSSPARSSPPPKPIDIVSAAPQDARQQQQQHQHHVEPSSPASLVRPVAPPSLADESYQPPGAQYSRPPRLPLPIEEELHTPGSPIISPADLIAPAELLDGLPRRASVLSSTTVDDDDLGDDLEALEGGPHPPVPTLIEWRDPGEKVYVTGTFAGWDRKFRLHRNGPSKQAGSLSATINLQPGTHHIRFIVDNDMKLSSYMPTAVDFTNTLVNYIEIVPEPEQAVATPAEPVDIPSGSQGVAPATEPSLPRPVEYRAPPGVHPPHILPPTPELIPVPSQASTPKATPRDAASTEARPDAVSLAPSPPKRYHNEIPRFLLDLDAAEETPEYGRANSVLQTAPAAPSLPMFLNKSILNGTTPMKDDASVLNMPNHTMLNHLATSSIKNKVLATSATTRYKRKFLTTIMYKPTSAVGE